MLLPMEQFQGQCFMIHILCYKKSVVGFSRLGAICGFSFLVAANGRARFSVARLMFFAPLREERGRTVDAQFPAFP